MERFFGYARQLLTPETRIENPTVTVYRAGTATLATIYADNLSPPTARSNPFSGDSDGFFFFYAPEGRYDTRLSGGTPAIPTPYTWGDVSLYDPRDYAVNVKAAPFFATGDGVTDDTAAIAAAYAAVTTGILYFPSGTYVTTGSLTPKTGVTFRGAGRDATLIAYSGTGFWLDLGGTGAANHVGWEEMTVRCSGAALGPLRVGLQSTPFDAALLRVGWALKNLYLQAVNTPMNVGSIGLDVNWYIDWTLHNVTINNFERPHRLNIGGNSTFTRVRRVGFKFEGQRTNTVGGCQDTEINPEFIGPTTTGVAGVDYGYTCEINCTFVKHISALYEAVPGGRSRAALHIMATAGQFVDINGAFSGASADYDNLIVFDAGYTHPKFIGTAALISGRPAIVFGVVGAGAKAEFLACDKELNLLVQAQPVTRYNLIGATSETAYGILAEGITLDPGTDVVIGMVQIPRGFLRFGTTPALTGLIRIPNNTDLVARNAANGADVVLLRCNIIDEVQLGAGADIRWGRPVALLGGGATATLGTIGGAGGPTAAGQNAWFRVIDSDGIARLIPNWLAA